MATITTLASLLGGSSSSGPNSLGLKFLDSTDGGGNALAAVPSSGSITGGGSAQDGLSQVNNGASTIANAIGQAQSALGVGNGNTGPNPITFKKGGSVKKKYKIGRAHV